MEQLWYYAKKGSTDRQGPVNQSEIEELLRTGSISSQDLVWREGMSNWQEIQTISEFAGMVSVQSSAPPPASSPAIQAAPPSSYGSGSAIPDGLQGWMTFFGVMMIIGGVCYCISCIYLIPGIFLILGGSSFLAAKNALDDVEEIPPQLQLFFEKLRHSMKMMGIFMIIFIVVFVIFMCVYMFAFAAGMASAFQNGTFPQ